MKSAALIIGFLLLAWAINGEVRARIIDEALGIPGLQCRSIEVYKVSATIEQKRAYMEAVANMPTHEVLYTNLRDLVLGACVH